MKIYEILKNENLNKKYKNRADNEEYIVLIDMHSSPALFTLKDKNCAIFSQFEILNLEFEEIKDLIGWEIVNNQMYYYISYNNTICQTQDNNRNVDIAQYECCNYFSTKQKAKEVLTEQELYRKMKKFYDENDGKVDWNNNNIKFYIIYDNYYKAYDICDCNKGAIIGTIHFSSEQLARRCIKEVIKPFYEKH